MHCELCGQPLLAGAPQRMQPGPQYRQRLDYQEPPEEEEGLSREAMRLCQGVGSASLVEASLDEFLARRSAPAEVVALLRAILQEWDREANPRALLEALARIESLT